MRRKRKKRSNSESTSFWQSYSDMMAALLLVFVLIIATAKFSYEKLYEDNIKAKAEIEQREEELEKERAKAKEDEQLLQEQQDKIDNILGIRTGLIEKMKIAFDDVDMGISVDSETGAISFDSNILFDYDKANLKATGVHFLQEFFPKYFDVILNSDFSDYIAEVIIEGHTDNDGTYIHNLELSQQRAFAVAEYCLGDNSMFSGKKLSKIRKLVTANGRANNDLIYKDESKTRVDKAASRRVEIKFRLTEDEMIAEMSKILEAK